MKYLVILIPFFLFSCIYEDIEPICYKYICEKDTIFVKQNVYTDTTYVFQTCFNMTKISDSLPIKLWINDEVSFNNKNVPGVNNVCFNEKFDCEDTLKLFIEEDEQTIINYYSEFNGGLNGWSNVSDGTSVVDWVYDETSYIGPAAIALSSPADTPDNKTDILYTDNNGGPWMPGNYTFTIIAGNASYSEGLVEMYLIKLDESLNVISGISFSGNENLPYDDSSTDNITVTFTLTEELPFLGVQFGGGGSDFDILIGIKSVNIAYTPTPGSIRHDKLIFNEPFDSSLGSFSNYVGGFQNPNSETFTWSAGSANVDQGGPNLDSSDDATYILARETGIPGLNFRKGSYTVDIGINNTSYNGQPIEINFYIFYENGSSRGIIDVTGDSRVISTAGRVDRKFYFTIDNSYSESETYPKIGFSFARSGPYTDWGMRVDVDYVNIRYSLDNELIEPTRELRVINSDGNIAGRIDFNDYVEFVPSEYGICNSNMSIEVYDYSSPQQKIAYSDMIYTYSSFGQNTINKISYWNNSSFDGIPYGGGPEIKFTAHIDSQFWKETADEEFEDDMLSSNEFVRVYNQQAEKTLLEIGYVPNYMHKKIRRILMHDNVVINGKYWIKRDEYEHENLNRYPLSKANVWLTDKNSIIRNVV